MPEITLFVHKMLRKLPRSATSARLFHTSKKISNEVFNSSEVERPEDDVDVCIVGGGPAGLSAAIRLKQLEKEKGKEIRVVVLEKGSEIGTCFLSQPHSNYIYQHMLTRLAYRLWSCDRTTRIRRTASFLVLPT